MQKHPLHRAIGKLIDTVFSHFKIIKDPACETTSNQSQNLPLFCCDKKSNETEFCNVDILILNKDKKIKVIIEIEEANIKPTQICGKFLTSALSRFFIHKTQKEPLEMDSDVLFVQILDISKLDPKSAKPRQWKRIEQALKNIIPVKDSSIKQYKIFYGTKDDFDVNDRVEGNKLVEYISNFICS